MKTIAALLIFGSITFAQISKPQLPTPNTTDIIFKIGARELVLQYAKECQKDSISICLDRYRLCYDCNGNEQDWSDCKERKWVRKTPTFQGFIDYLLKLK